MDEEMIGGTADPRHAIGGLQLDPRTGAIVNFSYEGMSPDGRFTFVRKDDSVTVEDQEALSRRYLEDKREELWEFSRCTSSHELERFAKEWGPLFGGCYAYDGVIREPVSMWQTAALLFDLAFKLKAACGTGDWRRLREVAFEQEIVLDKEQARMMRKGAASIPFSSNQEAMVSACARLSRVPYDYLSFTFGKKHLFKNEVWMETRIDSANALEIQFWQTGRIEEFEAFAPGDGGMEEGLPTIASLVSINPRSRGLVATEGLLSMIDSDELPFGVIGADLSMRMPLGDPGGGIDDMVDDIAIRLCRNLIETLISIHSRHVHYRWIGHEFLPSFDELLRHQWFMLYAYLGKGTLAWCEQCGRPFMNRHEGKKYCSAKCRKNANR